jgi:hypothetical protein
MVDCFSAEWSNCSIFDEDIIKGDYIFTICNLFFCWIIYLECSIFTKFLFKVVSCVWMIPEYTRIWKSNDLLIYITDLNRVLCSALVSWDTIIEIVKSYSMWMNSSRKFRNSITNLEFYCRTFWGTECRSRNTSIV